MEKKKIMVKKHLINFPYHIEYKIITSQVINEYILSRISLVYTFNKRSKSTIKLGINSAIKLIESNIECMVFVFFKGKMECLYDLMIQKAKKLYFLEETKANEFMKALKVKKCLCFCLMPNEANIQVYKELDDKLSPFEMNKLSLMLLYDKANQVIEKTTVINK